MTKRVMASVVLIAVLAVTGAAAEGDKKASAKRIDISVTEAGFTPKKVTVKKGEETTLAFTRKTDKTCATAVVLYVNDKDEVEKQLPLNQVVTVTVRFEKSGELRYACGMDMISGVIVVP